MCQAWIWWYRKGVQHKRWICYRMMIFIMASSVSTEGKSFSCIVRNTFNKFGSYLSTKCWWDEWDPYSDDWTLALFFDIRFDHDLLPRSRSEWGKEFNIVQWLCDLWVYVQQISKMAELLFILGHGSSCESPLEIIFISVNPMNEFEYESHKAIWRGPWARPKRHGCSHVNII